MGLAPNDAGSGELRSSESKVGESWPVELEPIDPRLIEFGSAELCLVEPARFVAPARFAAPAAEWLTPDWAAAGAGVGANGAGPWITSSLLRTIALKVPVAAVHSGFGGGSMNTWLTSASGLNSNASSGMASSSSNSNGGGGAGGASRDGDSGAADGGACCGHVGAPDACCGRGGVPTACWGRLSGAAGGGEDRAAAALVSGGCAADPVPCAEREVPVCCGARAVGVQWRRGAGGHDGSRRYLHRQ